jgi:hypothetical protein
MSAISAAQPASQGVASSAPREASRAGQLYIVGPVYDWVFFLLPPTLALGLGILISGSPLSTSQFHLWGQEFSVAGLLIGAFIHAHLVIVFFRSHGNPQIFATHRLRFLLAPPLIYAAMLSSAWVLVSVSVLTTFWDVYHSGLQTFGFGRIYDSRQGNDPMAGRRLDWWLNQLLYAGPIIGGATMLDHFGDFDEFASVGDTFFTKIPALMTGYQGIFAWALLGFGSVFIVYYLASYWRLRAQGYRVSLLKAFLYASTGLCSVYSWGFNSWGEAFFIMNFFHAFQYFGLVWASEQRNLGRIFGLGRLQLAKPLVAIAFVSAGFSYGFWVESLDSEIEWLWAITLVVSMMHFWYDGFIWSVRKKQV